MLNQTPFSGYQELLGWRLIDSSPDRAVIELDIEPHHLNRSGYVHGGVLASLLDTAMSFAALHGFEQDPDRKALTLSLTNTFVSPARSGTLRAVGLRRGGGRRIFLATGEVTDHDNGLIALGEGSFKLRSGDEGRRFR